MRHPVAILLPLLCLSLQSQQTVQRHPAGTDAEGNQLTVIEKHFPDRPAEKPDTHDPVDVRLLWTSGHRLLAQIIDPGRTTKPATSWINADHLEIWMGQREEDAPAGTPWQFGIPRDEGPVQVGYGQPKELPTAGILAAFAQSGFDAVVRHRVASRWVIGGDHRGSPISTCKEQVKYRSRRHALAHFLGGSARPPVGSKRARVLENALVSFVSRLGGRIWKMLIRRGVADSGIRNRNAQVI